MASLTKEEVQNFIGEVTKLRDAAYEQSLEHSGAIKAAEYFLLKLNQEEVIQPEPKKVRRGRPKKTAPADPPKQQREGDESV
jgi:hypothetical protein